MVRPRPVVVPTMTTYDSRLDNLPTRSPIRRPYGATPRHFRPERTTR